MNGYHDRCFFLQFLKDHIHFLTTGHHSRSPSHSMSLVAEEYNGKIHKQIYMFHADVVLMNIFLQQTLHFMLIIPLPQLLLVLKQTSVMLKTKTSHPRNLNILPYFSTRKAELYLLIKQLVYCSVFILQLVILCCLHWLTFLFC